MNIQEEIRSIQTQISQAQARLVRKELELETATNNLKEAKAKLNTEFNVVKISDARKLDKQLEAELIEKIETTKRKLSASS